MRFVREDWITTGWDGYELLDSGHGMRLERFGAVTLCRPAQQAIWSPALPKSVWLEADAKFVRDSSGKGKWTENKTLPGSWMLTQGSFHHELKPTSFGHIGFFPEQQPCWAWLQKQIAARPQPCQILNLFAYTGSCTLAAAQAGASVCHLDASPPVVDWARRNASHSGLRDASIRWIVDEAIRFVRRELRRGNRYDGIILDPPSFGRGPNGEVFKLETELETLISDCRSLLTENPRFILLTCHTPGITGACLTNLLERKKGSLSFGELLIESKKSGFLLPSGSYAAWSAI